MQRGTCACVSLIRAFCLREVGPIQVGETSGGKPTSTGVKTQRWLGDHSSWRPRGNPRKGSSHPKSPTDPNTCAGLQVAMRKPVRDGRETELGVYLIDLIKQKSRHSWGEVGSPRRIVRDVQDAIQNYWTYKERENCGLSSEQTSSPR